MTIDLSLVTGLFVGPKSKKTVMAGLALALSGLLLHFQLITYEQFQDATTVIAGLITVFAALAFKKAFPEEPALDLPAPTKEDISALYGETSGDLKTTLAVIIREILNEQSGAKAEKPKKE